MKMLLKVRQCLVCISFFHLLGVRAQWGNDGNVRASHGRDRIAPSGSDDSSKGAYSRIFFEEAEQEIAPTPKKTSEELVGEKKSLEKSIDDKISEGVLGNKENETMTSPQSQGKNASKARKNSIRRRKKKDQSVKRERTNTLRRKPGRRSSRKMINIADEKQGNRKRQSFSENSDAVSKSKRAHRSNVAISILEKSEPHKRSELVMKSLHYDTTIRARYLRTTITANIKNSGPEKKININVILPQRAVITKFATWINDKLTTAKIKGLNSTINRPKAQVHGVNVGTRLVRARDCDAIAFSVSFHGLMSYTITYEYLLERYLGFYRIPIYIHTNQWIEDLSVTWRIHEDRNLTKLQTPLMHGPNSLPVESSDDSSICLTHEEPGIAELIWQPTIEEQKKISRSLKGKGEGVVGVLEVNYDVARQEDPCGEVVRQDKWFTHFYSPPSDNFSHAKHVVFVLDVSETMEGKPLEQLKIALNASLVKLRSKVDKFTVINFAEDAHILDVTKANNKKIFRSYDIKKHTFDGPSSWPGQLPSSEATLVNVKAARRAIQKLSVRNHTNIFDGLYMGYKAIIDAKMRKPQEHLKGLNNPHFIVFINSGRINNDPEAKDDILDMVKYLYRLTGAPVFALGLGPEVDRDLMRKLAVITRGREKHIYRGADTHQQIATFFDSINWPVRTHYSAKFDPKQVITSSLTEQTASVAFRGSEISIAGKLDKNVENSSNIYVDVSTRSDDFISDCEKQQLNLRKSEDFVEAKFATTSTNSLSKRFPSLTRKSLGTVGKIWAFKTLMELQARIDSEEAFRRSAEAKAEYGDAILFHQPTMCDDPLSPNERILEIALRFNYAVSRVTSLIYDNIVLQRIGIDPEVKLSADWNIHFLTVRLKNRPHTKTRSISIRRNFMDVEERHTSPLSCNNSVNNEFGECRPISDCPDIRLYTTKKIFRKHVCRIGTTTGVCCPESVPRPMQYIE